MCYVASYTQQSLGRLALFAVATVTLPGFVSE